MRLIHLRLIAPLALFLFAGAPEAHAWGWAHRSVAAPAEENVIPVYPRYPYRAGHYPTADDYYALPPYAAISPSFYRHRYFLMAQERNRYRYMPHVFHGREGY